MRAAGRAISVLLPVRNGASTLRMAIADLQSAMGPADELLVVDDGSEDSSPQIIAEAMAADPRVRVARTEGVGLVGALNLGMREARHAWVARADADDRYPPDRLNQQRAALGDGVVLVTGDYRILCGGQHAGNLPSALTAPFVSASLVHPQRIPHPGVVLDRDAVLSVGGYREGDFPAEDLALWLRLARVGNLVGVPHPVVAWNMGRGSITHEHQASQRLITTHLRVEIASLARALRITEEDVERELKAYSGTRLEGMRRVLLARDLRSLSELGFAQKAYSTVRRSLITNPLSTCMATSRIVADKLRRDSLRRSLFHKSDGSGRPS